jgi:hypothetical protein
VLTAAVIFKPPVRTLLVCSPQYDATSAVASRVSHVVRLRHTLCEFSGSATPTRKLLMRHRQLAGEEQREKQAPEILHG